MFNLDIINLQYHIKILAKVVSNLVGVRDGRTERI